MDSTPFPYSEGSYSIDSRVIFEDDTTYHRSIATTGETEAGTVDVETDQGLEIGIVDVHLAVHQGAVQIPTQRAFFKVSADASTCPRPSFSKRGVSPTSILDVDPTNFSPSEEAQLFGPTFTSALLQAADEDAKLQKVASVGRISGGFSQKTQQKQADKPEDPRPETSRQGDPSERRGYQTRIKLRDLAKVMGNFAWAIPAVPFAQAHYRKVRRVGHVGCPDMKRTKVKTASKVRWKVTYAGADYMLTPYW
ncbi:hypothetical protein OUZ56_016286 [Daphnia magna]|uniref:Uncharacterized protein n=1 Tax=Daphnia magna TaxID=35525 RepID=A0ABR0AQD4_9CRUS|nr:hypothetical protein OUZ56_016286 [Daphnia magna]